MGGVLGTLRLSTQIGADVVVANEGPGVLGSVVSGTSYAVAVTQQPVGPWCHVENGTGVLSVSVSNIVVRCAVLMTANQAQFRAGELAQLDGIKVQQTADVQALVDDTQAVLMHQDRSKAMLIVPELTAGTHRLKANIGGRDHWIRRRQAAVARRSAQTCRASRHLSCVPAPLPP